MSKPDYTALPAINMEKHPVSPAPDRLMELLNQHQCLYGMICRDITLTDIELMAMAGYHIVWIDLEHSPLTISAAVRFIRSITHLGMIPLVRIPELLRTHVQPLLDGGAQILALPDVRSADQAATFVRHGKFPPLGSRGVSTTTASNNFQLGPDRLQTFQWANDSTHLMVIFESDEGYDRREQIIATPGVDLVSVGPMDWSTTLGLAGSLANQCLAPKIEQVLAATRNAGKIPVMPVSSPADTRPYFDLGVRIFFTGVDITLKRKTLIETIQRFQAISHGPK
ncbi:MAG: hypothetical protein CMJ81_18435 [Planctomycetaceae bacterium]|nr:hypothetical protein [Planctomycetaceae bacterium]